MPGSAGNHYNPAPHRYWYATPIDMKSAPMLVTAPLDPLNFRDCRFMIGIEIVPPRREFRCKSLPGIPSTEVLFPV